MLKRRNVSELLATLAVVQSVRSARRSSSGAPARLLLVVNKSCASRCRYCQIWRQNRPGELSVEDYARLARSVPRLTWLGLTGGEPFERSDLVEIVRAFQNACPRLRMVNLTTNGLQEEQTLKTVQQLCTNGPPLLYVNVSIDGPPAIHDRLRGVDGNFHRALALLRRLRGLPGVRAGVSYTLHPENLALVDETVALIRETIPEFRQSELSLNLPHASSHYFGSTDLPAREVAALSRALEHELQRTPMLDASGRGLLKRAYLKVAAGYLTRGRARIPCSALRTNVYISESGEVYPCHTWERTLGNLRDVDFQLPRLLDSAVAARTRQEIFAEQCPGCWSPCEAYPSLLAQPGMLFSRG